MAACTSWLNIDAHNALFKIHRICGMVACMSGSVLLTTDPHSIWSKLLCFNMNLMWKLKNKHVENLNPNTFFIYFAGLGIGVGNCKHS